MYEPVVRTFTNVYESYFFSVIQSQVQKCGDGIDLVRAMESTLHEQGLVKMSGKDEKGDPGIVKLEASLLNIGSLSTVCQGLIYFLPVELEEFVMVR